SRKFVEGLRENAHDRAAIHVALAQLALRENKQSEAEKELQSALALDPKSVEAHQALGFLSWLRNDLKAAGEQFKAAADLSPPRSPMRLSYADFLFKTGRRPEAEKQLEEIASKFPEYLPPRVGLMKIACAEIQDDNCIARVQNILAQDP